MPVAADRNVRAPFGYRSFMRLTSPLILSFVAAKLAATISASASNHNMITKSFIVLACFLLLASSAAEPLSDRIPSVLDLPMRAGDPLTPLRGATRDAERLSRERAETIMKIPVLPISSVDAEKLFRVLEGPVVPDQWKGALPLTYRFGGSSSAVARLKLAFNWDLAPAYHVIARVVGSDYPDEWVLRGNHHDAWVIGARDPMSGLVPLLEQARAFAQLREKTGGRPKRTVLFCVWDAEEPGLLGSTEWCEHHAAELREKAVAYVNTDTNARGLLGLSGSHALETFAAEAAREVIDPQTGVSISDRLRAWRLVGGSADEKQLIRARRN